MTRAVLIAGMGMALIALASPPAAAGGGGCHEAATEDTGSNVEMLYSCFTPTVLHVDVGTTVTFTNRDDIEHVVAGIGWEAGGFLGPGAEASYRFEQPGTYPYSCYLHPGMNGVVVVGDGVGGAAEVVDTVPAAEPEPSTSAGSETASTVESSSSSAGTWAGVAAAAGAIGLGSGYALPRRRNRVTSSAPGAAS